MAAPAIHEGSGRDGGFEGVPALSLLRRIITRAILRNYTLPAVEFGWL
jgi:hypothetical protein